MKNKAKCKLCESVIESFHQHDYVSCKCGEISIDGGEAYFRCSAKDWNNFLRVDDQGNEIAVKVKEDQGQEPPQLTKQDLINILVDMRADIERLPVDAMSNPVNQYDMMSLMMILISIFKAEK